MSLERGPNYMNSSSADNVRYVALRVGAPRSATSGDEVPASVAPYRSELPGCNFDWWQHPNRTGGAVRVDLRAGVVNGRERFASPLRVDGVRRACISPVKVLSVPCTPVAIPSVERGCDGGPISLLACTEVQMDVSHAPGAGVDSAFLRGADLRAGLARPARWYGLRRRGSR